MTTMVVMRKLRVGDNYANVPRISRIIVLSNELLLLDKSLLERFSLCLSQYASPFYS